MLVFAHLAGAALLLAHAVWLACRTLRAWRNVARIAFPAAALAALVVAQIGLGAATWVVNYGWPEWSRLGGAGVGFTIEADGGMQANVVTSHVALGSLILGFAALLTVRSWRLASLRVAPVGAALVAGIAMGSGAGAKGVAA